MNPTGVRFGARSYFREVAEREELRGGEREIW